MATSAEFKGKIVMMAGNRGLILAFCAGAESPRDVQRAMSGTGLEQYRIGLDSIVQRMLIHRHQQATETDSVDGEAATRKRDDEVSTTALLTWMARSNKADATILAGALRTWLKHPDTTHQKEWEHASELLEVLEAALAPKGASTDG
jgi:ABC-type glycerol-3-phosphate transport system substrate-binding protein